MLLVGAARRPRLHILRSRWGDRVRAGHNPGEAQIILHDRGRMGDIRAAASRLFANGYAQNGLWQGCFESPVLRDSLGDGWESHRRQAARERKAGRRGSRLQGAEGSNPAPVHDKAFGGRRAGGADILERDASTQGADGGVSRRAGGRDRSMASEYREVQPLLLQRRRKLPLSRAVPCL